jgi:hypothetical protein
MKKTAPANRHRGPILAAALALGAASAANAQDTRTLPSDAYEQPRHSVVLSVGNAELRRYEPMLLAEVSVQGERNAAARDGFRLLARYIFGGNQRRESISMTAPVLQAPREAEGERIAMTAPVMQAPAGIAAEGAQRWTVAFMLPSTYTLDTLPRPLDGRVQFRTAPGEHRAAVRFSGFSTASNLGEHREQLLAFVRERGWQMLGEPVVAFYDDPFTLPWNRRNEWWVAVEVKEAGPAG